MLLHPSKRAEPPRGNGRPSQTEGWDPFGEPEVVPASGLGPWPDSAFYFGGQHQSHDGTEDRVESKHERWSSVESAQTVIDYYRRNKNAPPRVLAFCLFIDGLEPAEARVRAMDALRLFMHTVMPTDFDLWRREIGWPTPSSRNHPDTTAPSRAVRLWPACYHSVLRYLFHAPRP